MARSDGQFEVVIIAETGVVHEGKCEALFVPSVKEQMVILAHHTPMIAKLGAGEIVVKTGRNKQAVANIKTGLLYVGDNEATVLLDL